jgi:eukaryotic translation initiation factor 2C
MGEHPDIVDLLRGDHFSDRKCLEVIDPAMTDREDLLVGPVASSPLSRSFPALTSWRLQDPIGLQLLQTNSSGVPQHTVRSNFFRVSSAGIPDALFHYEVAIYQYKYVDGERTLGADPEDLAKKGDKVVTTGAMQKFLAALDAAAQVSCGVAYDGAGALFTTGKLSFPGSPSAADGSGVVPAYASGFQYDHQLRSPDGTAVFHVVLRFTGRITPPRDAWAGVHGSLAAGTPSRAVVSNNRVALQAMDVALLSFARKNLVDGSWFLSGNTVFSAKDSKTYQLSDQFVGMLGYHASFRACISGLALVKDISVTCFLKGGNLIHFVAAFFRCDARDLARQMNPGNRRLDDLLALLKNCTVRTTHLAMRKKLKGFGAAANDANASFIPKEGDEPTTVAAYFQARYGIHLQFPGACTANLGTSKRPMYVPMELLEIVPGQTRQRSITGDISTKIIQHAAMRPNDRYRALTQGSFLFRALEQDADAKHFGISNIAGENMGVGQHSASAEAVAPIRVVGTILPPAKLQYANRVVEPQLKGAWNLAGGIKFAHAPTAPAAGRGRGLTFGAMAVLATGSADEERRAYEATAGLVAKLEPESITLGIPMRCTGAARLVNYDSRELDSVLQAFSDMHVDIVVVVLMNETFYPRVKFLADRLCLLTQCARFSIVTKSPRNYETSLLVKMNAKMGGTNHTLASRAFKAVDDGAYQSPPKSISWVFDVPAMVIGIDVNHPDARGLDSAEPSVVAVVASMDGMLSQYSAHITACAASREPVLNLHDSFVRLIKAFCLRNGGQFPQHIIVYRDGVSDSQFMETLDSELRALKGAIESFDKDEDYVKVTFVVCQKRHHTRFFYKPAAGEEYLNPCVGLCVDARGFTETSGGISQAGADPLGCIVGSELVEFYLNSHAAVLGTSKPTRYVLLHDEIGLKLSELELLTFWLTHLYARCTRSVSIVAPAYYAHWAAKRGRVLLTGGLRDAAGLKGMSEGWLNTPDLPGMYFI